MKFFKRTYHTIQLNPNDWWVVESFSVCFFGAIWCRLYGDETCDKGGGFLYESEAQKKKRELQKLNNTNS